MDRIKTALQTTGYDFAHCAWRKAPPGDYGTYMENEGADLEANGKHVERGTVGYIDYFTRDDSGAPRDAIEAALDGICIYKLESVQFENETGYMHYEWRFALYG